MTVSWCASTLTPSTTTRTTRRWNTEGLTVRPTQSSLIASTHLFSLLLMVTPMLQASAPQGTCRGALLGTLYPTPSLPASWKTPILTTHSEKNQPRKRAALPVDLLNTTIVNIIQIKRMQEHYCGSTLELKAIIYFFLCCIKSN